jgi:hypothetical protein
MKQAKTTMVVAVLLIIHFAVFPQQKKHGNVITEHLSSSVLRGTKIGLDSIRIVKIYLPPGYSTSGKSYPVVYYLHNIFSSAEKTLADGKFVKVLERGFEHGVVKEFIVVIADYSSPTSGSLYENSLTSGRWLDFIVGELVPFIDTKFRTIRHRDSRALAGDFMGGRGALKLSMTNPEIFSVVYALHPVATGTGYMPWAANDVNWKKIHQAKTFSELAGDGRAQMFVAIAQAFLPNPNRPPFYCDFWMELENGEPKIHVENTLKAQNGFLLDHTVEECAKNLRTMNAIAFDWARYDPTPTHVYTNQAFTRKLEDLGIDHEAEEYRGTPWDKNWIDNGRVYTRMLPFFNQHLVFDSKK